MIRWKRIRPKCYKSVCGRFEIRNWGPAEIKGEGDWLLITKNGDYPNQTLKAAQALAEAMSSPESPLASLFNHYFDNGDGQAGYRQFFALACILCDLQRLAKHYKIDFDDVVEKAKTLTRIPNAQS